MMNTPSAPAHGHTRPPDRATLRSQLLQKRKQCDNPDRVAAAMAPRLREILLALEPQRLGLYWPLRGEFNPVWMLTHEDLMPSWPLALPWTQKNPPQMHYRSWSGSPPPLRDDCNIPAPDGPPVLPDVVLVPCVGYTDSGLRLGYGGGYFDRFLAAHPHVTAIGLAPSWARLDPDHLKPEPHDIPLPIIVTELGVVTPP